MKKNLTKIFIRGTREVMEMMELESLVTKEGGPVSTTKLSKCMFRLRQWESSTASTSTVMTIKEEELPQAFRAGMNSQKRILESMNWPSKKCLW